MAKIELLNEETIDKIAAGEVVEKPASVVKELVENAIDAHATSITVEIKDGGISFIRITDNGDGIEKNQVKKAFFRHATSKLRTVEDLDTLLSLGFRGEALSSISAVSQVEIMTKTKDELIGTRYSIEGAVEKEFSEVGIPNGTTIIVKNLFFNTPARRKFLKSAITEGNHIADICEHLALSRPDISFKFVSGGQMRFNTSGDGDLKEVIYRIYGRDVAKEMIAVSRENKDISINGYIGKPVLNRSNRNFEKYFVNGRYVRSQTIANAIENGYKEYLMQHKFPFCVLDITVNTTTLDVNVHPTKMEIRFNNEEYVSDFIDSCISSTLKVNEMIPEALLEEEKKVIEKNKVKGPEPYEFVRKSETITSVNIPEVKNTEDEVKTEAVFEVDFENNTVKEDNSYTINSTEEKLEEAKRQIINKLIGGQTVEQRNNSNVIKAENAIVVKDVAQMDFFEEKLLSKETIDEYKIVGQLFDTYWLFEYKDKLLILDQHAAHEKVKYEAIIQKMKNSEILSQQLNPPIILTLSANERAILDKYNECFSSFGYEIEEFGGCEIAIRSVPLDLYGLDEREVFIKVLDELMEINTVRNVPNVFNEKIASMACKAAVKGNNSMTVEEVKALLNELLTLENPYNCPHGRPTIVFMTKYEIDKKFKRIVT